MSMMKRVSVRQVTGRVLGLGAAPWLRLLIVTVLLVVVAGSAVLLASRPAAAQGGRQATSDGRDLLLPACVPDTARPAPEAGTITFAMCPDHLTIKSATTASDITFYPAFSPDRHSYVVHVADGVSEVRLKMGQFYWPLFTRGSEGPKLWPGWTYVSVEADDARTPSSPGNLPVLGSNNEQTRDVLVRLSPGVNTVQIVPSQWFKRFGPSQAESANYNFVRAVGNSLTASPTPRSATTRSY